MTLNLASFLGFLSLHSHLTLPEANHPCPPLTYPPSLIVSFSPLKYSPNLMRHFCRAQVDCRLPQIHTHTQPLTALSPGFGQDSFHFLSAVIAYLLCPLLLPVSRASLSWPSDLQLQQMKHFSTLRSLVSLGPRWLIL